MDLSVFLGALLGALFGLLGALLLDRALNWWGREEQRQRFRSLIAQELVRNLTFIARIEHGATETEESGYAFYQFTTDRPRVDVLKLVLGAGEALMSLSEKEQSNLIETSARIDKLNTQCDGWIQAFRDERGQLAIPAADGTTVSPNERLTRQLFESINLARESHMLLLALVLARTDEKRLIQPVLLELKAALQPTVVRRWGRYHTLNAFWASPAPLADDGWGEWPVVVWERGASTYSGKLIELKPIIGD